MKKKKKKKEKTPRPGSLSLSTVVTSGFWQTAATLSSPSKRQLPLCDLFSGQQQIDPSLCQVTPATPQLGAAATRTPCHRNPPQKGSLIVCSSWVQHQFNAVHMIRKKEVELAQHKLNQIICKNSQQMKKKRI